jgi:hypothetical protein
MLATAISFFFLPRVHGSPYFCTCTYRVIREGLTLHQFTPTWPRNESNFFLLFSFIGLWSGSTAYPQMQDYSRCNNADWLKLLPCFHPPKNRILSRGLNPHNLSVKSSFLCRKKCLQFVRPTNFKMFST